MSQVDKKQPKYWRSLAELENDPEFRETITREFRVPLDEMPTESDRRRFIKLMGASFALAGLTSACRWKEDKMVEFSKRPQGMIPGEPRYYATTMELAGDATGLIAISYDGRPIKLEGNPWHPTSLGAANAWHQASLLELYDPDRAQHPTQSAGSTRKKSTWEDLEKTLKTQATELKKNGGKGLRVMASASSSPSLADAKKRLLAKYPDARWIDYDAIAGDEQSVGLRQAFGKGHKAQLYVGAADVVVSLDCDFIAPGYPASLVHARQLISRRMPDGKMNRIYAVESAYTHVGSVADHRLPLRAAQIKAFAAALDAAVSAAAGAPAALGAAQTKPNAAFLADPKVSKFLAAVAKDLVANKGRSLVIAGPSQPAAVHALVARINAVLTNVDVTVTYVEEAEGDAAPPTRLEQLATLVKEMAAGQVDTLIVLGENPVYTAPADLDFAAALAKVKTSIALATYEDETAKASTWHVPQAHWLETWGDAVAHDGSLGIAQPLIAPLFGGKSAIELCSIFTDDKFLPGREIVRRTHQGAYPDDRAWKKLVHDGLARAAQTERKSPELKPLAPLTFEPHELGGIDTQNLEITFAHDPKVYDGRFANNAWLQELPEPFTKFTWGNAALVSPETAAALGVTDGTPVRLTLDGKSIELPVIVVPGQAKGSIKVTLGYGRTSAGVVGGHEGDVPATEIVGANAYVLRTTKRYRFANGVQVTKLGEAEKLATTQDVHAIDDIGRKGTDERVPLLLREGTLAQYKKQPDFAKHAVHHPPLLSMWRDPVPYSGHKWGMAIDLSRCIGCNACVTACQAENNVAIVGRENVKRGREMLWLRVDRYYKGNPEEAEIAWQPLPCMQCENAPCEQVCPVGATMHSNEGLNDMVYNRCIGTRYCANNCPYKVRRFNYFNYHLDVQGLTPWQPADNDRQRVRAMVYNPEVTVRARGVMEKCTFCVQRIQNVKIRSKNAKRAIQDGEIKTACQQTCPTDAIVFGDLNDKKAKVAGLQYADRAYKLLEELNNRPRVSYLARIKNPNPELG